MDKDFIIKNNILIKYTGLEKIVKIPENINCIDENCFLNNKYIEEVILPKKCNLIRKYAFQNCTNLKKINLENITEIDEYAFYNCENLEKINIKNANYISINAFENTGIKEINIESITSIEDVAFLNCQNLEKVKINKIVNLDSTSFENCDNLKEIDIKDIASINYTLFNYNNLETVKIGAQFIDSSVFENCEKLKTIEIYNEMTYEEVMYVVGVGNKKLEKVTGPNIITEDGIVYSKNKKILISYLEGNKQKTFNIPNETKLLIAGSIYENENLQKIIINDNPDIQIERFSINGCVNLTEIEVNNSKPKFEENSISRCDNFEKLNLKNTKLEEFNDDIFSDCDTKIDVILPTSINNINLNNEKTKIFTNKMPKKITGYKNCEKAIKTINLETLISEGKTFREANQIINNYER